MQQTSTVHPGAIPPTAPPRRLPGTVFNAVAWLVIVTLAGGAIWGLGMTFSLVAATTHFVGPAVSYAIGQGATMVSAAWGVFVWREFAGAPASATTCRPAKCAGIISACSCAILLATSSNSPKSFDQPLRR